MEVVGGSSLKVETESPKEGALLGFKRQATPIDELSERMTRRVDIAIVEVVIAEALPFSIVNSDAFRNIVNVMKPTYTSFDRTLLQKILRALYEEQRDSLRRALGPTEAVAVHFTSDGWTSLSHHHHISLTAHWLDNSWKLHHALLGIPYLGINQDAVSTARAWHRLISEFELAGRAGFFRCDAAAVMPRAAAQAKVPYFRCLVHLVQLVVRDALAIPVVAKVFATAKRVVTFFHHSSKATDMLRQRQEHQMQ